VKHCPHCGERLVDTAVRCRSCRLPVSIAEDEIKTFTDTASKKVRGWMGLAFPKEKQKCPWNVWEILLLWGLVFAGYWGLENLEWTLRIVHALQENFFIFTKEPLLKQYVYVIVDTFFLKLGACLAIAFLVLFRKTDFGLLWSGAEGGRKTRLLTFFFFLFSLVISLSESFDPLSQNLPTNLFFKESAWIGNSLMIFSIVIVAPVTEEIFFRGFMYPGFRKTWGALPAVFLTSFLFAVVHWPQLQGSIGSFLVILAGGFLLTSARAVSGSTRYSAWLHMIYNGTIVGAGIIRYLINGY